MSAADRTLIAAMAEPVFARPPFRELLHRSIALRAAEQIVPDAQWDAVNSESYDTDRAIKARLCETLGLAAHELALLGDML